MFRNRVKFRQSLAFKWVVSYAVIMLIPLIASAIVYLQTTQIVEYEIQRANDGMLKQVKYIVDSELKQAEKLAAQLSIHSDVLKFLELDADSEEEHAYFIYKTKQELNKYKSSNDFISSIYLYSYQLDKVLTNDTYAGSELFFDITHRTDGYTYDHWLSDLQHPQPRKYYGMPVLEAGKKERTAVFMEALERKAQGMQQGTLIMPLNSSKIQHLLGNVDWVNKGKVYIIDEHDQVLFQNGTAKPAGDSYLQLKNDEESMVSFLESDIAAWRFVSVFPTDVFWDKAREIRNLNLLGLLLCCLVGGGVIMYFARRNYDPVQELMSIFPQVTREDKVTDEYAFIRESMLKTLREKDDMSNHQMQQMRVLQSYYLARLLKGQSEQAMSLKEVAKMHRIEWQSEFFAVLLFYMDPKQETDIPLNLSHFIVSNIVKDLVNRSYSIHFTELDGLLAAILNLEPDQLESWREETEETVSEAIDFIQQRYKLSFAVSGSEANCSVEGIHQAFLQALEAQEYRLILEENALIWYGDIKPDDTAYSYSMNEELVLINWIKSGEFPKASEMVDDMIANIFSRQASIEMVKCLLIDLASTMIKAVPQDSCMTAIWEERRPLKRLLACSSRAEFRQGLQELLSTVCELSQTKLAMASNAGIGEQVAGFVEQNYADVNLSVSMIGTQFGITPQYVSKLFKEYAGGGLHDYISKTRIREAKRLLEQDASIDETSSKVGFLSSSAFIRVFKKYEGITPGRYKSIQ
ncbi:hypothetical protein YSY43_05990 [Paenibacillus sp. YSY-4.3]